MRSSTSVTARIGLGHSAAPHLRLYLIGACFVLPVLLFVVAVFVLPAAIAVCVRGEPDNAVRHESGEPDDAEVKQR